MADKALFEEYVAARSPYLLRIAYLLTRNRASAQDLLQEAFLKTWFAWSRIGDPESYVRRVLVTSYISGLRRRWRAEVPSDSLPDSGTPDASDTVTQRLALWEALGRLPRRQRALVVLRYFADLTEAQTADALGVSVGTVKSQTSRALAKLRVDASLTTGNESLIRRTLSTNPGGNT